MLMEFGMAKELWVTQRVWGTPKELWMTKEFGVAQRVWGIPKVLWMTKEFGVTQRVWGILKEFGRWRSPRHLTALGHVEESNYKNLHGYLLYLDFLYLHGCFFGNGSKLGISIVDPWDGPAGNTLILWTGFSIILNLTWIQLLFL